MLWWPRIDSLIITEDGRRPKVWIMSGSPENSGQWSCHQPPSPLLHAFAPLFQALRAELQGPTWADLPPIRAHSRLVRQSATQDLFPYSLTPYSDKGSLVFRFSPRLWLAIGRALPWILERKIKNPFHFLTVSTKRRSGNETLLRPSASKFCENCMRWIHGPLVDSKMKNEKNNMRKNGKNP